MNKFVDETETKIWNKQAFQRMRLDMEAQGFPVTKTDDGNGYECRVKDGRLLLKAMNGKNGYLVRQIKELFQ